jgi:hypothetical protein
MVAQRPITRRSLLTAGAAAMTGALLRSPAALALSAREQSDSAGVLAPARWRTIEVGDLQPGATVTVDLRGNADLAALQWRAPRAASVQMRFRRGDGAWSPWACAAASGHAAELRERAHGERMSGEGVWSGGADSLQLRARRAVAGASLMLVDVSHGLGAARAARLAQGMAASAPALAQPLIAAGAGQPPIIARREWALGDSPPARAPGYGTVRLAFVHHTESPNGYSQGEVPAMLRAIYVFHRYGRGWNDIGYNFVVDLYGRIFEARAGGIAEPVVGAHAGGYNIYSTGIAVLGEFGSVAPSPAAIDALEALLAWKLPLHCVPIQGHVNVRVDPSGAIYSRYPANAKVSLPRIAGHRDADSTECPGNALYPQLPGIRTRVSARVAHPVSLTLGVTRSTAAAPAPGAAESDAGTPAPGAGERDAGTPAPGAGEGVGSTPAAAEGGAGAPAPAPATSGAAALNGTLAHAGGAGIAGARIVLQQRSVSDRGQQVQELTIGEALTGQGGGFTIPGAFARARHGGVAVRALFAGSTAAGACTSEPLQLEHAPAGATVPVTDAAPTS